MQRVYEFFSKIPESNATTIQSEAQDYIAIPIKPENPFEEREIQLFGFDPVDLKLAKRKTEILKIYHVIWSIEDCFSARNENLKKEEVRREEESSFISWGSIGAAGLVGGTVALAMGARFYFRPILDNISNQIKAVTNSYRNLTHELAPTSRTPH